MAGTPEWGTIEDRLAIADTLQAYARAIDAFDFDAVAAVFTDDCVARYKQYEPLVGGRALAEWLRSKCVDVPWHQHNLNVVSIAIDGDTAEVLTYFVAHTCPGDQPIVVNIGDYRDRLIRTVAGWRICERVQSTRFKETRPPV